MKNIFLVIAFFYSIGFFAQISSDSIMSKKMGESREISVFLPSSYEKNKTKRYPLLVVFDADYLFDAFTGALKFGNYWDDLPEVIVVGIKQNKDGERETDCEINAKGLPTKKAIAFFDFVNTELLPSIEKKYRTANLRIVAGHDLTAGFANLFLYQNNPAFNGYICLSPELDQTMQERVPAQLAMFKRPVFYYQATADGDPKDVSEAIKMLGENLKTIENPNLFVKTDDFLNASHYSLVLYAIPNALYHIFSAYKPITNSEYKEKIAVLEKDHVLYLIKKYDIIKRDYAIDMPIRFSDFKAIEAAILKNKDYNAFDELAQLARKNYPKSMLADYFLAQQFENKGEDKQAMKYYLNAYQNAAIGDLTKEMMMEKVDEIKMKIPKKSK